MMYVPRQCPLIDFNCTRTLRSNGTTQGVSVPTAAMKTSATTHHQELLTGTLFELFSSPLFFSLKHSNSHLVFPPPELLNFSLQRAA